MSAIDYTIVEVPGREMRYEVRKSNEDPPHAVVTLASFTTPEAAKEYIVDVRKQQRIARTIQ